MSEQETDRDITLKFTQSQMDVQRKSIPDDIRARGWTVAVHNDYRLNGEAHTFWLFTKDGRAVKGEGRSDAAALNSVRAAIAAEIDADLGKEGET